jgi:two-component system cell cycle response regulator DivK
MPKRKPREHSKPLVLIVDDYVDNREMYAEYFRFAGYRVELAETGDQAVAKARKLSPAVVVMDLSLPVLDGWEAIRLLKSDPKTRAIWIIAVTGHGEPHFVTRAKAAGADDFALKPLTPEDLVKRVVAGLAGRA